MSLGRKLDMALPPGRDAGVIRAEAEDGASAEVEVVDVDRIGASVRGIRVTSAVPGSIAGQAVRLPEAVRPLPERVIPVEVDPRLGGAVLRSAPEEMEGRDYYEVRTDGRSASVERFRAGTDGAEKLPYNVTRDQLRRLVDGLRAAMPEPEE